MPTHSNSYDRAGDVIEKAFLATRIPAALLCGLLLAWPGLARADSVVTNCAQADLANALAGGGNVTFTQDCAMTFLSTIQISGNLILDGAGHTVLLSGNNAVPLFNVQPGANFILRGVTLAGGKGTAGGAIYIMSGAQVVITNCILAGNSAQGDSGGDGDDGGDSVNRGGDGRAATDSTPGLGGAIYNLGTLTILNTLLVTNSAIGGDGGTGGAGGAGGFRGGDGGRGGKAGSAYGGAIWNGGKLSVTDSTFSANQVTGGTGGAGGAPGTGPFPARIGAGNAGGPVAGAAIYNTQNVAVVRCTFNDNVAAGGSGSVGGTAYSGNGAIGSHGGDASGGGVATTGTGGLTNCTFFNNQVTGGTGGDGGIGRFGGRGGRGGNAAGGGVWNSRASTTIENCTFDAGGAKGGTNGAAGSGIFSFLGARNGTSRGGSLAATGGKILLLNSILADSSSGNNAYGRISDGGHNLSSDRTPALRGTSKRRVNPQLDTLADNGGPTKTVALLTSSPARNAGNTAPWPPQDQRGAPRPADETPDIGAFEVSPPFILTQPQDLTVTNGGSASFTVSAVIQPPVQYQWLFNGTNLDGATSASLSFSSVTASNAGLYSLLISTGLGSVTSAVARLTVLVPPVITTQPQNLTNVIGGTAIFSVVAGGTPPLSYQWQFNGTNLTGATGTSLVLNGVQTNDAGGYTVVVSNPLASVTSAVAVLSIWVPPAITAQPQSRTNIAGTIATFSVTATGTDPLAYQWQVNGDALAGATRNALVLANVQATNAAAYTVVVSNGAGAVTSAIARLIVWVPPTITSQPQSRTNVAGSQADFSVTATGTAPLSYQWQFNGAALDGATGTSLAVGNLQTANEGNYTVVVTNVAGSVTSAVAVLTVLAAPTITAQPQSQTNGVGTTATFTVAAIGSAPLSYQWQFNGAGIASATATNLSLTNIQPTNAGGYTVVVTNAFGSVTSAVAVLTVADPFIVTQPADAVVVTNAPVVFTVAAGGTRPLSYQWRFNSNNLAGAAGIVGTNDPFPSVTLAFTNLHVQLTDAGYYDVVLSNSVGTIASVPARLGVSTRAALAPLGFSATNFSFVFQVQTGFTYLVQYTTNLNDTNWLPLGSSLTGFDGSWTNQDFNATNSSRFYRVLVR